MEGVANSDNSKEVMSFLYLFLYHARTYVEMGTNTKVDGISLVVCAIVHAM
jgi:hypothetical protein